MSSCIINSVFRNSPTHESSSILNFSYFYKFTHAENIKSKTGKLCLILHLLLSFLHQITNYKIKANESKKETRTEKSFRSFL